MQINVYQQRVDQWLPIDEQEEGSVGWRNYRVQEDFYRY